MKMKMNRGGKEKLMLTSVHKKINLKVEKEGVTEVLP